MEKIATKTKILLWGVVGEKEKIDFELCHFSSDQVAQLDRMVRADGDNTVRLTIEPEQKKLQIAALQANVGLVSLSCREKGQKLKIRGFRSPDERATALKRMSAADTPILLTIEEIQGSLFGDEATAKDANRAKRPEGGPEQDVTEKIPLKFKALRGCKGMVFVRCDGLGWRAWYDIQVGNLAKHAGPEDMNPVSSRVVALQAAKSAMQCWLEDIEPSGSADAKRALKVRLAQVCEQLDVQLAPMLNAAEKFAEDEPEELNADEDQEI